MMNKVLKIAVTDINKDLSVIKAAYNYKNTVNQLKLIPALTGTKLTDALKNWLAN